MRSLLEEPEVLVIGAGQGPAGSIIHKMFVSAQRVRAKFQVYRLTEWLFHIIGAFFLVPHKSNSYSKSKKYYCHFFGF